MLVERTTACCESKNFSTQYKCLGTQTEKKDVNGYTAK